MPKLETTYNFGRLAAMFTAAAVVFGGGGFGVNHFFFNDSPDVVEVEPELTWQEKDALKQEIKKKIERSTNLALMIQQSEIGTKKFVDANIRLSDLNSQDSKEIRQLENYNLYVTNDWPLQTVHIASEFELAPIGASEAFDEAQHGSSVITIISKSNPNGHRIEINPHNIELDTKRAIVYKTSDQTAAELIAQRQARTDPVDVLRHHNIDVLSELRKIERAQEDIQRQIIDAVVEGMSFDDAVAQYDPYTDADVIEFRENYPTPKTIESLNEQSDNQISIMGPHPAPKS